MLRAGNAYIELWEYHNPQPKSLDDQYSPADHGYAHIALQVSGIHEEYDRLIEAGMTFHEPPVELEDLRLFMDVIRLEILWNYMNLQKTDRFDLKQLFLQIFTNSEIGFFNVP